MFSERGKPMKKRMIALLLAVYLQFSLCGANADTGEDAFWDSAAVVECFNGQDLFSSCDREHPFLYLYACTADILHLNADTRGVILDNCLIGEFRVSFNNPVFRVRDGVLFSRDGSELVLYPSGRKETHYDIPSGTKRIAKDAFADTVGLRTVSFPLGLNEIGEYAFYRSGIIAVSLPPTVKRLDKYAFADCVMLETASVPTCAQMEEDTFFNCPLLNAFPTGGEGFFTGNGAEEPDLESGFCMAANPAEAADLVYAYTAPDGKKRAGEEGYACGDCIGFVEAYDRNWYRIAGYDTNWNEETGMLDIQVSYRYVKRSEVIAFPQETMFTVTSVFPKNERVTVYFGSGEKGIYGQIWNSDEAPLHMDGMFSPDRVGWCTCVYHEGYDSFDFLLKDASVFRDHVGDGKNYALVVASEPRNRVHLRKEPDKASASQGRYFSGTQAEILESRGSWYRVRIGLEEGWMMKEYLLSVPEEPEK